MGNHKFTVKGTDGLARRGSLDTPHGTIETPAFAPVGTNATVKTLDNRDLRSLDAQVVLANTYHLYLRPGAKLVKKLGGLHGFMGWDGPTITDSGGFQVFSLGFGLEHGVSKISGIFPDDGPRVSSPTRRKLMKVTEDGVSFRSHLDGSRHTLTPESSISIQQDLGADVILAFDECTSPLHGRAYTTAAMERTHRWAKRCLNTWTKRDRQALFGIVQGGAYEDLRTQSARRIDSLDFPGIAIGGSLGKSTKDMWRVIEWSVPLLAPEKPRHLLGIGEVTDIFESVERGVDLFDCVAPTRMARHGTAYVSPQNGGRTSNKFRLSLSAAKHASDKAPIDAGCQCYTCQHHHRAYLRHLFATGELLGPRLATIHNLHFILNLMSQIRESVERKKFRQLKKEWLS